MKLNFKKFGKGKPFIIIHGLFGSSDNWIPIAKKLSNQYTVYIPDLRNHGDNEHTKDFNFNVLSNDLIEFIDSNKIEKPIILGHSLGGRIAMHLAFEYPNCLNKLIIVDVAPKIYNKKFLYPHIFILKLFNSINISNYNSITSVKNLLYEEYNLSEITVNLFLKNIKRTNKQFEWKINSKSILDNIEIMFGEEYKYSVFNKPTLIIKGQKSDYIKNEDKILINKYFINNTFLEIKDCSHWVHSEKPEELIKIINSFL